MSISAIRVAISKGKRAFTISLIFILAILQATNKSRPTGGVIRPIARFTTIIIPKCNGFTPTALAKGSSKGTRTIIAELASRKHPAIKRRIFIRRRITILLLVAALTHLTSAAGTP